MVAVDSNVLVRLLTGDNPVQFKASVQLFATQDVFIADTVLLETEWVLRAAFDLTPTDVIAAFRRLLGLHYVSLFGAKAIGVRTVCNNTGTQALGIFMSVGRKIFKTAVALVAGSAMSALVVLAQLPVPHGVSEFQVSRLIGAFVLSLLVSFLLPWASGPQPLPPFDIAILVTAVIAFVGTLRIEKTPRVASIQCSRSPVA